MATIEDVARLAGVSTATVSRVINRLGPVSERTRLRVWKAIETLRYSPHIVYKLAKSKKVFSVAICISERIRKLLKNHEVGQFYDIVLESVEDVSKERNLRVSLQPLETVRNRFDGYLLLGADVDSAILSRFKNFRKPFLLVDHCIPGKRVDCVVSDGYYGAFHAVNHLVKKGFKRIVHVHGPLNSHGFRSRFDGYMIAMEKAGLIPKTYEYDDVSNNISSVMDAVLRSYGIPEAIFASNDITAMKIINDLKVRGLKVPDDVEVVGFDDIPLAESFDPPLTTVKVFKYEMGSLACKRLRELLLGYDTHPVQILVSTKFVRRKSSP